MIVQGSVSITDTLQICRAIHPFQPQHLDELSFLKDQYIIIHRKVDGGWYEGITETQVGWFPTNHVEVMDEIPQEIFSNPQYGWLFEDFSPRKIHEMRVKTVQSNQGRLPAISLVDEARCNLQSPSAHPSIPTSLRNNHIKAIIDSELKFYEDLNHFCETVVVPLREASDVLPLMAHETIFRNIEEIVDYHHDLYREMNRYLEMMSLEDMKIGQLIMDHSSRFSTLYLDFFRGLPDAISLISSKQYPTVWEFLMPLTDMRPVSLFLVAMLHKPIQRCQRYVIGLYDILYNTPESHPDYLNLVSTLDLFNNLVSEGKKVEHIDKERHILAQMKENIKDWKGLQVKDLGRWKLAGEFRVRGHYSMFQRTKKRLCILFDHYLLMIQLNRSAFSGPNWRVQSAIPVNGYSVHAVEVVHGQPTEFSISFSNSGDYTIQRIFLSTRNLFQRNEWFEMLHEAANVDPNASQSSNESSLESRSGSQYSLHPLPPPFLLPPRPKASLAPRFLHPKRDSQRWSTLTSLYRSSIQSMMHVVSTYSGTPNRESKSTRTARYSPQRQRPLSEWMSSPSFQYQADLHSLSNSSPACPETISSTPQHGLYNQMGSTSSLMYDLRSFPRRTTLDRVSYLSPDLDKSVATALQHLHRRRTSTQTRSRLIYPISSTGITTLLLNQNPEPRIPQSLPPRPIFLRDKLSSSSNEKKENEESALSLTPCKVRSQNLGRAYLMRDSHSKTFDSGHPNPVNDDMTTLRGSLEKGSLRRIKDRIVEFFSSDRNQVATDDDGAQTTTLTSDDGTATNTCCEPETGHLQV